MQSGKTQTGIVTLTVDTSQNRPNILIISADHHRAECIGVAGRQVKTPHLDALARRGTRFGSCITPSVASQPARASILTGQLCLTHGVHDDGLDLDPVIGEQGFAGTLANADYETALFGKAHFSHHSPGTPTGTPECVESSATYDEQWHGPYMGFQHVELMLSAKDGFTVQTPPKGHHYERFFHADGEAQRKLQDYRTDKGHSINPDTCWHSGLPPAHHSTVWTADRAIDWLRHGRDSDKPFCAWVSFAEPHHPYDCPEPWSRLHKPEDIDLPTHRTPDSSPLPWWYRSAMSLEDTDENVHTDSVNSNRQKSDTELREIIANTYGKIAFLDDQIGRLMNVLVEQGLSGSTHVFYLSDHGDWLGDRGLTLKGPMFYDCMLRVPMIWSGPDIPRNRVIYEPVSTIDLAPSILDLAGAKPQLAQHGESLLPLLDGKAKRDYAMSEWELLPGRVDAKVRLRCVRTRTYKLIKDMNSGHGELYDLLADPNETCNLFEHPESMEIRIRLESYLNMRSQDFESREAA